MDELIKLFGKISDFWGWAVGLVTGALAAFAAWRKHGRRFFRSLALSDRVHDHFGEKAGDKIVEEFSRRSKDIILGEVRQQFIESKLGIALYVCSPDGSCEYANEAIADLFGLERAQMLGNGWMRAVNRSERQKVMEFWEYAVQHKMPYDYEYGVVNQETMEKFKVSTRAFPVVSKDGSVLCYVGMVERLSDGGKNP